VANCKVVLGHYIGLKKRKDLSLSLTRTHTHTNNTHTHIYVENFILASMYRCVTCSRWYTPDLHTATVDSCTTAA